MWACFDPAYPSRSDHSVVWEDELCLLLFKTAHPLRPLASPWANSISCYCSLLISNLSEGSLASVHGHAWFSPNLENKILPWPNVVFVVTIRFSPPSLAFSTFSCIFYLLITHPHLSRPPAGFCLHLATKPALIRAINDLLTAKPNGSFWFLSHWITFAAFVILSLCWKFLLLWFPWHYPLLGLQTPLNPSSDSPSHTLLPPPNL